MDAHNLVQLIKQPNRVTYTSKTRIALLFTNKVDRIDKTYNLLSGLSDHNFIFFTRKLSTKMLLDATNKKIFLFWLHPKEGGHGYTNI